MTLTNDDFYFDEVKHPNDFEGNPAYAPVDPGHPSWRRMTRWEDMGPHGPILRGMDPQWVYMHPASNWKVWHLAGPRQGIEGVVLAEGLDGVEDMDFEHRYSTGPYMIGGERERTDYKMGVFEFGVWINPNANPNRQAGGPFAMHKIEDAWRRSWSPTVPGFLGCFTRTHGWRWIPVIKGGKFRKDGRRSPTATGNQSLLISQTAHAPWPLFAKRAETRKWVVTEDDIEKGKDGVATHQFAVPNRGTFDTCAKFIIRGRGKVMIQDGDDGKMVPIPQLEKEDGDYMFVDTDPSMQTITTDTQPVDAQIYKYLRRSQFLELLLRKPLQLQAKLPAQRRTPGGIEFDAVIPGRTVANITVTHTNPKGSIEMIVPQMFEASWA